MKRRRALFWTIALGSLFIGSGYWFMHNHITNCGSTVVTAPNGQSITAAIADTPLARAQGLMGIKTLPTNHGMLFLFPTPGVFPFWMKDTLIPLDIIWINDQTVVDMVSLPAQEGTTIPQYTPHATADSVLEINQGQAAKLGISVGKKLMFAPCASEQPS